MDIFFNELSVQPASSDIQARQWLETLAELGKSLKDCVESLSDNAFTFRRSDEFGQLPITASQTLLQFMHDQYDHSDAIYNFLIGIFDSPYITEDDPKRTEFEYTSLTFAGKEYHVTGLAAAYLKDSLAVSFDSDPVWDTCHFLVQINCLDASDQEISSQVMINHASRKQHLIDCHLPLLANLFDWSTYRCRFSYKERRQTLLPLVGLYSLHVDDWPAFYRAISQMNEQERITRIRTTAYKIAEIQRWHPATGSLKNQNANRTVYTIPDSNYIVSVDTLHGHFEVHDRQGIHLGSISFDGLSFKEPQGYELKI